MGMDGRNRVAAALKDYLARERISREQFAFKTRLGKSTVDKLLIGLFSDKTLAIAKAHTKLPLRSMLDEAADAPSEGPPAAEPASMSLDRPSIAVLPFTNMGGDLYFADGITEDIITALARIPRLFVIARNSSFIYRDRAIDIRQVGFELGVRYVLEGSVRRAGGRLRITGQLIDATTGLHLWADRFDGVEEDVFDLQDRVTASVVGAISPHLLAAEIERAKRKRPEALDVYDLYLRALAASPQPVWTAKFRRPSSGSGRKRPVRFGAQDPESGRCRNPLHPVGRSQRGSISAALP
jgi:adenylate cyclase